MSYSRSKNLLRIGNEIARRCYRVSALEEIYKVSPEYVYKWSANLEERSYDHRCSLDLRIFRDSERLRTLLGRIAGTSWTRKFDLTVHASDFDDVARDLGISLRKREVVR